MSADWTTQLAQAVLLPFAHLFAPAARLWWGYLAGALALAFLAWRLAGGRGWRGFLAFCFPKAVFAHPSARTDYRFFLVNKASFGFFVAPLVAIEPTASRWAHGLLAGDGAGLGLEAGPFALAAFTLAAILAFDFGVWASHWLQHRVPWLWEFHKVHHSAETLTPVTNYRMHPVDELLAAVVVGLCSGLVYGLFRFLYAAPPPEYSILGLNVVLFAFYLFGFNLRHSHVWLSYPAWLSHLLVSPAQHQIHHSRDPRHFDRNFGLIFALWDWCFGTLYVPRARERLEFGLGAESRDFDGVAALYLAPFRKLLRGSLRPARRGGPEGRTTSP
jgi:sterol desaturase/sphingolipid hydroxylase (fatty acid hydroxylase superfamily)